MAGDELLIYGATGYTGTLISERCRALGLRAILGGRSAQALRPLAARLGLAHRVVGLDDPRALREALAGVGAVLHCAGPFSVTSAPMVDACLATRTSYLDITGERDAIAACLARDDEAREAGVSLIPAVGFDVVPSDCLAATLAEALPGATHLELALLGIGAASRGTLKSSLGILSEGGLVRRDGALVREPLARRRKRVPFPSRERLAVSAPIADLVTAHRSTGIPNIVVFFAMPPRLARLARLAAPLMPLLRSERVRALVTRRIDRLRAGPDEATRAGGHSELWGRVTDGHTSVEGTLVTPEAYTLTADTALESARRVLSGAAQSGSLTPSVAFGARYIEAFEGCTLAIGEPRP